MADESTSEDRSLEPSERKLQKAREQGRFAQSRDLSFLALMLLATAFVLLVGKAAWRACERMVRDALDLSRYADPLQHLTAWAGDALWDFALWLAVFLAAGLIAGLLAPLALTQLRPVFAPRFDLSRLDPVAGLKRLFTAHQLFALAKGVLVTLALLGVAAAWFAAQADALALPPTAALDAAMARLASLLGRGWQWLLLVVAVVAAVDAGFQWRQFRREMRMTVQELKEEHKESEGSPEVRARIRQLQREASRRRMMSAVEKADVLVVNPTHFAVALRYDARRMAAPVVVAKGEDEVALRMREVARRHEVPVAESPALARWLSARVADAGALRLAAPPAEGVVLQCEFPDRLWRINRRETFRVAASPRLGVDVVIGGERPQNYRLVDLGLGGMAFEVPAGDERPLAVGDRLEPCWLTGEEMVSHPFALVVRSVVAGSGDRPRRRVGASLAAEDALVTRDLQLAMYRLEAARRGR